MNFTSEIFDEIKRGVVDILVEEEFKTRLSENKPLRIKLGMDPTAADIHLGHTVIFNKLRQFQEMGHTIIFLIGDFTAMIGDPTGKDITRKPLSREVVLENAKTYQAQAFKILDPEKTEIVFNSSWLDKLTPTEMVKLMAQTTVARILERDDFSKRYAANQSIGLHEFLYPLLQGYDSVALKSDLELGGTDQTFNMLMGRELQKHYGQRPQCILTMPLLEGLDGVQKMSKSLGNYIGITESHDEIFGKLMSISDELMWRYLELLSQRPLTEIRRWQAEVKEGLNPRDLKILLAEEIVERYHDKAAAEEAHRNFVNRFRDGQVPENLPELSLPAQEGGLPIANLLKQAGLVSSTSEALRSIQQGAVKMDGERIEDPKLIIPVGSSHLYQVGKRRFAKVKID